MRGICVRDLGRLRQLNAGCRYLGNYDKYNKYTKQASNLFNSKKKEFEEKLKEDIVRQKTGNTWKSERKISPQELKEEREFLMNAGYKKMIISGVGALLWFKFVGPFMPGFVNMGVGIAPAYLVWDGIDDFQKATKLNDKQ